MAKKLCFSVAMFHFTPIRLISSINSPKNRPIMLSSFSDEQLDEIEEYLKRYTEIPYVIEAGNDIYVVIPSIFPTSSACLLLRMDFEPKVFLRFVKDKPDLFVVSKNTTTVPARMSPRLDAQKKEFIEFCRDLERAFMHLERFSLFFSNDEVLEGYCEELIFLSEFLAVPIDSISTTNADDGVAIKSNFALYTAFCATMMMLARNEATDRRASASIDLSGGCIYVKISFKTDKNIRVTNETFIWDYIARDKKMLYGFHCEDGRFWISFQPWYIDWSYLGMKQERNDTFFED